VNLLTAAKTSLHIVGIAIEGEFCGLSVCPFAAFPNDEAAMKVIYLATAAAAKKWTMPIRDWKPALNRFMIEFEGQLTPHV